MHYSELVIVATFPKSIKVNKMDMDKLITKFKIHKIHLPEFTPAASQKDLQISLYTHFLPM
ncbi:hypothetical protein HMPREF9151_02226 [Hoylesella saccharolytica F0055]|uniref:Uncharacterized protein n=1 Tax=Hoylesella saccharolytica F0055 TaxID=1127699 RepID=L1N1F7_9BACT|nr:hypothetical protein HMPREF9151_02226 [Hoylesella saccharolytica F0055]